MWMSMSSFIRRTLKLPPVEIKELGTLVSHKGEIKVVLTADTL